MQLVYRFSGQEPELDLISSHRLLACNDRNQTVITHSRTPIRHRQRLVPIEREQIVDDRLLVRAAEIANPQLIRFIVPKIGRIPLQTRPVHDLKHSFASASRFGGQIVGEQRILALQRLLPTLLPREHGRVVDNSRLVRLIGHHVL